MRKNKRKIPLVLLFFIIFSLGLTWMIEVYNSYKKGNNIYNIGHLKSEKIFLESKAFVFFDEFVFDNFNNIDVKINNIKVYGVEDAIPDTSNFQATANAERLNFELKNDSKFNINVDDKYLRGLKESVFSKNYSDLGLNFYTDLAKDNFSSKTTEYIKSYLTNKSIKLKESGYIVNNIDGYESLINISNIENIKNFKYNSTQSENIMNELKGLKYINNKRFYITLDFPMKNAELKNIKETDIIFGDKKYRATLIRSNILGENYRLVYQLMDGIEDFIGKRFIDVKIFLDEYYGYYVPKTSILKRGSIDGVYTVVNGVVEFLPVKPILEKNDKVFVTGNPDLIFTKAFNENNPEINKLSEFSHILINNKGVKEGERY